MITPTDHSLLARLLFVFAYICLPQLCLGGQQYFEDKHIRFPVEDKAKVESGGGKYDRELRFGYLCIFKGGNVSLSIHIPGESPALIANKIRNRQTYETKAIGVPSGKGDATLTVDYVTDVVPIDIDGRSGYLFTTGWTIRADNGKIRQGFATIGKWMAGGKSLDLNYVSANQEDHPAKLLALLSNTTVK